MSLYFYFVDLNNDTYSPFLHALKSSETVTVDTKRKYHQHLNWNSLKWMALFRSQSFHFKLSESSDRHHISCISAQVLKSFFTTITTRDYEKKLKLEKNCFTLSSTGVRFLRDRMPIMRLALHLCSSNLCWSWAFLNQGAANSSLPSPHTSCEESSSSAINSTDMLWAIGYHE